MSVIQETIDDFCAFVDELVELMQEDWERVKKFVKEYKNYVFWFIVLSITMQITDIGTLGRYVKRMCEEEKKVQRGGTTSPPPPPPPPPPLPPPPPKPSGEQKGNPLKNIKKLEGVSPSSIKNAGSDIQEARKIQREKDKEARADAREKEKEARADAREKEKEARADARDKQAELKQLSLNMGIDGQGQGQGKGQGADDELKQTEKQLSFFQRMKQKISGIDAQGKQIGALGPVFGGMDKAMDYMKNIFAILTFILTAIGIISLPVFIFLIITYFVIKSIATKLFIL